MQNQPKHQSIAAFAQERAKALSLKIFVVGVCSTFVIGLLFGIYYYRGQLYQTLGVVSKSLSQPLALGGDFLPTQIVKTLVKSGNFRDAWITLPHGKVFIAEHRDQLHQDLAMIGDNWYYWRKGMPQVLASQPIFYHNDRIGTLHVGYQIPVLAIFSFAMLVCVLFSLISLYLYRRILKLAEDVSIPLQKYAEELGKNTDKEKFLASNHGLARFSEIFKFNKILLNYIRKSKVSEALARKAISKAQVAKVATRVRHDVIVSLTIGETALERLDQQDTQVKTLKSVFDRISHTVADIPKIGSLTEDEMRIAAVGDVVRAEPDDDLRSCHVSAIVYQIIAEIKLSKLCAGKEIKFNVACSSEGFASYCEVEPNKFKRDLLNLYKNAVEAIETAGVVQTRVSVVDDAVSIVIADNGKGVAPENLHKVGKQGVTIGKQGGTGIGLTSAIEDVHKWGGKLHISSPASKGVTIEIVLPQAEENLLYPTSLAFADNMTIVVIDDDPLVYKAWQNRFASLNFAQHNINVLYAEHLQGAKQIVLNLKEQGKDYILLIDNELGEAATGIDFVKQMKVSGRSVLVTSSGNSNSVYKQYSQIGLAIVPKVIQERIPIGRMS